MTIQDVKQILSDNGLAFDQTSEAGMEILWLRGPNGHKDIELDFLEEEGVFQFDEMSFGDWGQLYADSPRALLGAIEEIMSGGVCILHTTDLKTGCCVHSRLYRMGGEEDEREVLSSDVRRIEERDMANPYTALVHGNKKHEIYDWNAYRVILK